MGCISPNGPFTIDSEPLDALVVPSAASIVTSRPRVTLRGPNSGTVPLRPAEGARVSPCVFTPGGSDPASHASSSPPTEGRLPISYVSPNSPTT